MTVPIQTVLWSQAAAARLLAPVRRLAVALLMLLALAQAMLPHGPASAQTMGGDLAWQVI